MRAYAILIVTFTHYFNSIGITIPNLPLISLSFHTFVVASFFWRSGYIFFKPLTLFDTNYVSVTLFKRFSQLILSTLAVIGISAIIYRHNFPDVWNNGFGGYYFNSSLFDVIAFTLILALILHKLPESVFLLTLTTLSLASYIILFLINGNYSLPHFMNWREAMFFFPFFAIGIICRKNERQFINLIRNRTAILISLTIFILSLIILIPMSDYFRSNYPLIHEFAKTISSSLSGLTLFAAIFFNKHYTTFICTENAFNRFILFLGRRSLDIYLFHYLFIDSYWINDNVISHFLSDPYNNDILRFTIGTAVALFIAFLSAITGDIFRLIGQK